MTPAHGMLKAMELKDKVVLITGGQRVGQFVARELAASGASLAMTYLKERAEVEPVLKEVTTRGGVAKSYQLDLSDEASIDALTAAVTKDFSQIDALINMASLFTPDPTPLRLADIQKTFAINTFGTMLLSHWFAEASQQRQASCAPIVSFIDWAVDHPYANHDTYLASKAALRHYLMALQTSFAGSVRVVNIHPGMILEPAGFPSAEKQVIVANTPTQSIGTPEQAAKLVKTALELDFWVDNVYLAGGQQWRHRV